MEGFVSFRRALAADDDAVDDATATTLHTAVNDGTLLTELTTKVSNYTKPIRQPTQGHALKRLCKIKITIQIQ